MENINSQSQNPESKKSESQPPPVSTPNSSQPAQPTTSKVAPLSIKIFSTFFLLAGLQLLFALVGSLLFIFSRPFFFIATLILFLALEKTAIDLYKLNERSVRNSYIASALYALYLSFGSNLLYEFSSLSFTRGLITTVITFFVLAVPFFIITRKGLPAPSKNPKKDNIIIIAILIIIFVAGGIYSSIQNRKLENALSEAFQKTVLDTSDDSSTTRNKIARPTSEPTTDFVVPGCDTIVTTQFIENSCGIDTGVSLDAQQSIEGRCLWATTNENSDVPQIIRELSGGEETILTFYAFLPLNVSYEEYKEQTITSLGTEAEIEEQNDVGSKSFNIIIGEAHELVFKPTSGPQSLRLMSKKCDLDVLKTIGRAIIDQL